MPTQGAQHQPQNLGENLGENVFGINCMQSPGIYAVALLFVCCLFAVCLFFLIFFDFLPKKSNKIKN